LNDSADQHNQKHEAAHSKLTDLQSRVAVVERFGPTLLELKRSHSELSDGNASFDAEHAGTKERLDNMEALFGDASNRQSKDLLNLKGLHDKHASMLTKHASQLEGFANHQEHHATIPERMAYVEQVLGDSADKHEAELAELHKKVAKEAAAREKHHGSIKDLLAKEQDARNNHHSTLNERVDYLEGVLGDNADKHAREVAEIASGHQKLHGSLKSQGDGHGAFVERVNKLEKAFAECTENQARQAKAITVRFDSFSNKLHAVSDAWTKSTPRVG